MKKVNLVCIGHAVTIMTLIFMSLALVILIYKRAIFNL